MRRPTARSLLKWSPPTAITLVLREAGFGGSEWLENGVGDQDAGAIRSGDEILCSADGGGDDVNVGLETLANHTDRVADAVLRVDDEFVG